MNENDIKLLENNGWTIECKSPFEIRHEESESFATGYAADIVLDSLKSEENKDEETINDLGINFIRNENQLRNEYNYVSTPLDFGYLGIKTTKEIMTKFYYFFKNEGMF